MGDFTIIRGLCLAGLAAFATMAVAPRASAQVLLAEGQLISSKAGSYADLSGLTGTLENGACGAVRGTGGAGSRARVARVLGAKLNRRQNREGHPHTQMRLSVREGML